MLFSLLLLPCLRLHRRLAWYKNTYTLFTLAIHPQQPFPSFQCGYFESMFNGSWREAQASSISIDIPDDNIDADGKFIFSDIIVTIMSTVHIYISWRAWSCRCQKHIGIRCHPRFVSDNSSKSIMFWADQTSFFSHYDSPLFTEILLSSSGNCCYQALMIFFYPALSIAFGCLYRDDLTIEPVQVISVLAAASLLQLEGLMQQCAIIMKETISWVCINIRSTKK